MTSHGTTEPGPSTIKPVHLADADPYVPEGHTAVVNRLLVGRQLQSSTHMSVWHGRIEPGGSADLHTHDHSDQVFVVVSGVMTMTVGGTDHAMGPMTAIHLPSGTPHNVRNGADETVEVLVISAPALA